MKNLYIILLAALLTVSLGPNLAGAMQGAQHGDTHGTEHGTEHGTDHGTEHGGDHGAGHDNGHGGTYKHMATVDDIQAEFQVMSLASMDMSDPDGNTHHVMATFAKGNDKITKMVGKVKLIAPSGKEQTSELKDYGGGNFAANFLIDEDGKWGVICLFKDVDGQHTVKFWYPHTE